MTVPNFASPARGGAKALLVLLLVILVVAATALVAGARRADAATESLFPTAKPAADPDTRAVTVGTVVRAERTGRITGIRFYKRAGNTGKHTAGLFSDDGSMAITGTFSKETKTGWQTWSPKTAIWVRKGAVFTVAVHMPRARYAAVSNYRWPAKSRSLTGMRGVYSYGPKLAMPAEVWESSNYFIDVLFVPNASSAPPTASPKPTASPTASPKPTASPTASPKPTASPTASPKPTASPTPKPSPSPTQPSSPKGGRIVLGRSFPNEATTGVPAGTTLTPYTGSCLIQSAGTVIDSKTINCELRVFARNVVIKNSLIKGSVYTDSQAGVGSFTITDSTIDQGAGPGTGIGDVDFTATRVEVFGGTRSINCYRDCTVRDSYVHGQWNDTSGVHHESGIRMNTRSTLVHNTIACDANDYPPDAGCSAAISGYPDFDPVEKVTIDNNLVIAGSGGYCAYGGSTSGKPFSGKTNTIKYTNNIWERGREMGAGNRGYVCGYWGPITSFDSDAPGNVWTNNLYDDGTPVPPAN